MPNLTAKKLQEFWELCGFQYDDDGFMITFPNGELHHISAEPQFTLDNLFEYAVSPMTQRKTWDDTCYCFNITLSRDTVPMVWEVRIDKYWAGSWTENIVDTVSDRSLAQALYQAIQKARRKDK